MKKTEDQKEFEKFAVKKSEEIRTEFGYLPKLDFRREPNNEYGLPEVKLAFSCWVESKRIQREHAKG